MVPTFLFGYLGFIGMASFRYTDIDKIGESIYLPIYLLIQCTLQFEPLFGVHVRKSSQRICQTYP